MLARNEYHINNDPNFILKKLGFFSLTMTVKKKLQIEIFDKFQTM